MEVRSTLDTTTRLYGAAPEFTVKQLAVKIAKGKLEVTSGDPTAVGSTVIGFLRDGRGRRNTFGCKVVEVVVDKRDRIFIR